MGGLKKAISPFLDTSGNKNIGATICIGREIQCLPYTGFFVFKIPDLVHRCTAAPVAAENRRWMALQTS